MIQSLTFQSRLQYTIILPILLILLLLFLSSLHKPTTHIHAYSILPSLISTTTTTTASPIFGIGSLLLKPKNIIIPSEGDDDILLNAAICFTDAFWNGKTGGGVKTLSSSQSKTLMKQQIAEFKRRYGFKFSTTSNNIKDRRAELVVCQKKSNGEIMGCAGIEVSTISTPNGKSIPIQAPLMSNLAVGKKFRRRGLAEDLVKAAEDIARKEWGYEDCYLFVEKQNLSAMKLYRKLGYKSQWEDDSASTLLPTKRGAIVSAPTTIVCMKKRLGAGLFGRFL